MRLQCKLRDPAPSGGDGHAVQRITVDIPANRLHLVSVNGHGIARLKLRPRYELDAEQQVICLDMAPSSNVMLGIVPTLAEHSLPELRRRGVPVTVSTDIPGFLGHGLSTELARCADAWSLGDDDLVELAETSLRRSYAPEWVRRAALADLGG